MFFSLNKKEEIKKNNDINKNLYLKLFKSLNSYSSLIVLGYDLGAASMAWFFACGVPYEIMLLDEREVSLHLFPKIFSWFKVVFLSLVWLLPIQCLLFRFVGLYRGFWQFASIQDLKKILFVSILGSVCVFLILKSHLEGLFLLPFNRATTVPFTSSILYGLFLISFLSLGRLFIRLLKNRKHLYGNLQRVVIAGAGNAGEGLVRDLLRDKSHHYLPVAFLDDDPTKLNREIHGVRVVGVLSELPRIIEKYQVGLVLIAIPSATSNSMRSVVQLCEKAKIKCFTLPSVKDLANGCVSINKLRNVSLEDLIGRYPVTCRFDEIKKALHRKTILISGGGGSIGSELCRQIASLETVSCIIIVDKCEFNLYSIDLELKQKYPYCVTYSLLLDVTDRVGIRNALSKYKPNFVFHAAAYKHVPLLENQVRVAVYNNVIGTAVLAEEAAKINVDMFVLISSDKAVNPSNVMGATKCAAEYFCQNINQHMQTTKFITVRFGNVLDSAGSVIPLFRKQIEEGGPVTVTHPDITRFFMTIPEASQLILQAAILGEGGEIFVLDMGEPINIRYLAEQMIKLAGKTVTQDIKIQYTGLRSGEKLYEECFYQNEFLQPTSHPKILKAKSRVREFFEVRSFAETLLHLCHDELADEETFIFYLKQFVPEYKNHFTPFAVMT